MKISRKRKITIWILCTAAAVAAAYSDVEDATQYLQTICQSGYNVGSINYALALDYNYPVPIYQVDEAVRFLRENETEYGISTSHIVFSGGSAGGQLLQ